MGIVATPGIGFRAARPSFLWRTDALLEEYRRAVNPLSAEMYRLEWAVTK